LYLLNIELVIPVALAVWHVHLWIFIFIHCSLLSAVFDSTRLEYTLGTYSFNTAQRVIIEQSIYFRAVPTQQQQQQAEQAIQ